jgi:hypothetical protein
MPAGWKKMSATEITLANDWYNRDSIQPSEIARRLKRDKSVITRHVIKKIQKKKQGRPAALTKAQVDFLEKTLNEMIVKADTETFVTAKMLRRRTRVKASERTIRDALHKRNIRFRPFREKPALTEEDVKKRKAFAKKYRNKKPAWWNKKLHAAIDGKFFKVYLTGKGRKQAAAHGTKGAYRSPGKGLDRGYVKHKKGLQQNTGAKSALIVAGVGAGRVSMWHQVPTGRWSGKAAEEMYQGSLLWTLKRTWPGKRSWSVLFVVCVCVFGMLPPLLVHVAPHTPHEEATGIQELP